MTVDLIIPTLGQVKKLSHPYICFENLHHIPWPVRIHIVNRGKSWAEAINIGLRQTDGNNDIILMDDDVFINGKTFSLISEFYDQADIFGFKLLFPDGKIQHMGGYVKNGQIGHIGYRLDSKEIEEPLKVCHATTSLVYIKRRVIDALFGMAENMPGIQMEDVDFSFRALKKGFTILCLPSEAIHLESATKRHEVNFQEKISEAFREIVRRHLGDKDFLNLVESYPKKIVLEEAIS